MKIKTKYDPKPSARRDMDWEAWDDDRPETSPVGYGADELAAINDLKQMLELE